MKKSNQERSIDIFVRSFDLNGSVNYVIKQDKNRVARIKKLMEYSYVMCLKFGKIYEEAGGTALILYPEKKRTSCWTIKQDISLAVNSVGLTNIYKVLKREFLIKSNYPRGQLMTYLWFIGVDPASQGKGIGTGIMQKVIADSNKTQRTIYLETSNQENLRFYKKHDFEIYHKLELGHTLYMLKKTPQLL